VPVASAGPYASLHLAPDSQPRQHPTARFLQAVCLSCRPTNSVKALKAQVRRNKQDEKQFVTQQLYELPRTVAGLLGHCSKGDSESEFF